MLFTPGLLLINVIPIHFTGARAENAMICILLAHVNIVVVARLWNVLGSLRLSDRTLDS